MRNTTENSAPPVDDILATIGYAGFVRKLFSRSGDHAKDFAHAVLGVVTEIHELLHATDPVNRLEERGDCRFYFVALSQVMEDAALPLGSPGAALEQVERAAATASGDDGVSEACNELLDTAKRWAGYGKPPGNPVGVLALATLAIAKAGGGRSGDHGPAERANIAKLLKRYSGGVFSADQAVNRDTQAERRVLEDAARA